MTTAPVSSAKPTKVVVNPYLKRKKSPHQARTASSSTTNKKPIGIVPPPNKTLSAATTTGAKPVHNATAVRHASQSGNSNNNGNAITRPAVKQNEAQRNVTSSATATTATKKIAAKGTNKVQQMLPASSASKASSISSTRPPPSSQQQQQPKKSLKAKLKQEIENIRRAALVEKEKKRLRKEQKAVDKKKRMQEKLQAIEDEKRRKQHQEDEERRRLVREEQEKMARERQRTEADRQAKLEEERQKQYLLQQAEVARAARRQMEHDRQVLLQIQQQQNCAGGPTGLSKAAGLLLSYQQQQQYQQQHQQQAQLLSTSMQYPPSRPPLYYNSYAGAPSATPGTQPHYSANQQARHQQPQQQPTCHQPYAQPQVQSTTSLAWRNPNSFNNGTVNCSTNINTNTNTCNTSAGNQNGGTAAAQPYQQQLPPTTALPMQASNPTTTGSVLPGSEIVPANTRPLEPIQSEAACRSQDTGSNMVATTKVLPTKAVESSQLLLASSAKQAPHPGDLKQVSLVTPAVSRITTGSAPTRNEPGMKQVASSDTVDATIQVESTTSQSHRQKDPLAEPAPAVTLVSSSKAFENHTSADNGASGHHITPHKLNAQSPACGTTTASFDETSGSGAFVSPSVPVFNNGRQATFANGASTTSSGAALSEKTAQAHQTQATPGSHATTGSNNLLRAYEKPSIFPHSIASTHDPAKSILKEAMEAANIRVPATPNSTLDHTAASTMSSALLFERSNLVNAPVLSQQQWGSVDHVASVTPTTMPSNALDPNHNNGMQGYHHPQWQLPYPYGQNRSAAHYPAPQWYPQYSGQYQGAQMHPYSAPWQQAATPYAQHNASLYAMNGTPLPQRNYQQLYEQFGGRSYTMSRAQSRPREPKPPVVQLLALQPVEQPSPYAVTHEFLEQEFVIVKKEGESFGLGIREEKLSTLVELEWIMEYEQSTKKKPTTTTAGQKIANNGEVGQKIVKTEESLSQEEKENHIGGTVETAVQGSDEQGKPDLPPSKSFATGAQPGASNDTSLPAANNGQLTAVKPARKRRKRHFFAILVIVEATKQNERISNNMHLMPGDIILSINGENVGGMSFQDACGLFGKGCGEKVDGVGSKSFSCVLTIARRKPKPKPVYSISTYAPIHKTLGSLSGAHSTSSKPLTILDINAFADCVMQASLDTRRLFGKQISDEILRKFVALSPQLRGRDVFSLKNAWHDLARGSEKKMAEQAENFWRTTWLTEREEVRAIVTCSYLTDAKRAVKRASPRPVKGCKCGFNHSSSVYVNDPQCPLYSDLRPLSRLETDSSMPKKKPKTDDTRSLNVVETAFKDRIIKEKAAQKADEEEASFVDEMELKQLRELKKAIYAPSLTAMLLSAIAELQCEFPKVEEKHEPPTPRDLPAAINDKEEDKGSDAGDGDDDDDVPLSALLGKREAPSLQSKEPSKKQKLVSEDVNKTYLAKMLLLISRRWGHLYREPDNADYAWRWEVFHGGHTAGDDCKWEANATNPRRPGSYSFENLRFLLDDQFVEALSQQDTRIGNNQLENPNLHANAQAVLAHLLATERTGVYDELFSLVRLGIVHIKGGIPRLAKDWYARVDFLLLNEMQGCWAPGFDKAGKYMVVDKIRRKLSAKWKMTEYGWALKDEPDDIIFDFEEWEEYRESFHMRCEAQSDTVHGIGRFC